MTDSNSSVENPSPKSTGKSPLQQTKVLCGAYFALLTAALLLWQTQDFNLGFLYIIPNSLVGAYLLPFFLSRQKLRPVMAFLGGCLISYGLLIAMASIHTIIHFEEIISGPDHYTYLLVTIIYTAIFGLAAAPAVGLLTTILDWLLLKRRTAEIGSPNEHKQ